MKQAEFWSVVSQRTGRDREELDALWSAMVDTMVDTFQAGEGVNLGEGFGAFEVREREPERDVSGTARRCVGTPRRVVVFKGGKTMKRRVNQAAAAD